LDQNLGVSSFDLNWPSWEYLKDCQKLLSIHHAMLGSRKQSAEVTPSTDLTTRHKCPMGTKASKRRQEEEKKCRARKGISERLRERDCQW